MSKTHQAFIDWGFRVRQDGERLLQYDLKASPRSYFTQGSSAPATDFFARAERWRRWRLDLITGLRRRVRHSDHLVDDANQRFADKRLLVFTIVAINNPSASKTFDLTDRVMYETGGGWLDLHSWFPRGLEEPQWDHARQTMLKEIHAFTAMLLEQAADLQLAPFDGTLEMTTSRHAEVYAEAASVPPIEDAATAVLRCLAAFSRSANDPDRGRHVLSGTELLEITGFGPGLLDDALDILRSKHWIRMDRTAGGDPSGVEDVALTAQGRVEAHRMQRPASEPKGTDEPTHTRYECTQKLGEGAYGEAWRSSDHELKRDVAIKFIRSTGATRSDVVEQARALARVTDPSIVVVFDVAKVLDPVTKVVLDAVVMELVEGQSLNERRGQAMPRSEALRIGNALLDAIAAYHSCGLAHLDLHDGNVIVGERFVKVIDPMYFETVAMKSDGTRETLQQREIRRARDILVDLLRISDLPMEDVTHFERAVTRPSLQVLRNEFRIALEGSALIGEQTAVDDGMVDAAPLLDLLLNNGGGGIKLMNLAAELGWKPSVVRAAIEELARKGLIGLFVLNDNEVVYTIR